MSALCRLARLRGYERGLTLLTSSRMACRSLCTPMKQSEEKKKTEEEYPTKRVWMSYGFCEHDERHDRFVAHVTLFITVTLTFVLGSAFLLYYPDPKLHEWSTREAYLQIRHRTEHGLPLIDMNVVDPAKVVLPTDEELIAMEVIV